MNNARIEAIIENNNELKTQYANIVDRVKQECNGLINTIAYYTETKDLLFSIESCYWSSHGDICSVTNDIEYMYRNKDNNDQIPTGIEGIKKLIAIDIDIIDRMTFRYNYMKRQMQKYNYVTYNLDKYFDLNENTNCYTDMKNIIDSLHTNLNEFEKLITESSN